MQQHYQNSAENYFGNTLNRLEGEPHAARAELQTPFMELEDYGILGTLYAGVSGWLLPHFLRVLLASPILWCICGPCLRNPGSG